MSSVNTVALHIVLNLIIYHYFDPLKKFIDVYDFPDNKRKLHSEPIPLIGGFIFLINIIFFIIRI